MSEVCSMCGLVKELCVCETIAKEDQKITVYLERKNSTSLTPLFRA